MQDKLVAVGKHHLVPLGPIPRAMARQVHSGQRLGMAAAEQDVRSEGREVVDEHAAVRRFGSRVLRALALFAAAPLDRGQSRQPHAGQQDAGGFGRELNINRIEVARASRRDADEVAEN